jgi:hypothetical protein
LTLLMKVWRGVCPFEIQHQSYLDGLWLYPFLILKLSETFNDSINEMEAKIYHKIIFVLTVKLGIKELFGRHTIVH